MKSTSRFVDEDESFGVLEPLASFVAQASGARLVEIVAGVKQRLDVLVILVHFSTLQ
jgi:hypothetical protein